MFLSVDLVPPDKQFIDPEFVELQLGDHGETIVEFTVLASVEQALDGFLQFGEVAEDFKLISDREGEVGSSNEDAIRLFDAPRDCADFSGESPLV